jgi:hypothetical protein
LARIPFDILFRRKVREIPQIASGGGNESSCAALPISHLLPSFSHTLSGRKNLYGIVHPPSIISGHHGIHLRRFALRDGPADRYTFPVALFDKNLALLQYRLENLNVVSRSNKSAYLFPNELDFYEVADGFILTAIAEHANDEKRVDASRPFLEAIFGKDLELEYKVARSETVSVGASASATTFDGAYVTKIEADARSISTTIIDLKTEVHGDPLRQLAKRYTEEVGVYNDSYYASETSCQVGKDKTDHRGPLRVPASCNPASSMVPSDMLCMSGHERQRGRSGVAAS